MKKFFSNMLSSFMGAWIALVLFGVVATIVIIAIISRTGMSSEAVNLNDDSVLLLDLKGSINETDIPAQLSISDIISESQEKPQSLEMLVKALKEGKDNKRIKALYIKCEGASASPATLQALRCAVVEFKKSGKPIYAYGGSISQGDLYVASVADSLFVNPQGEIALSGVGGSVPYFKTLFDKVGIAFQVAKVGTYKSAVEPYIMDEMSAPARAQLDTLYGSIWNTIASDIAESRHKDVADIDSLVNNCIMFATSQQITKSGLVDGLCYEREMDTKFAKLLNIEKDDLNYISPTDLMASSVDFNIDKEHIAVLYAVGEIAETNNAGINWENLVPIILDLAEDENVKGLVMRVNSPGGSVFGSQQIADALKQFKATGKPFAVSMGDYAASGGYWISCDADYIFANPLTITGSIGIFGLIPNVETLINKLGVNFQTVGTNPNGLIMAPYKPLNADQMAAMQTNVEAGYDQFIERVANGRKMKESKVRAIAEGRVWDGKTALKIGLVDKLGSLQDAVNWVAAKADLKDPTVITYPKNKPSIWDMVYSVGRDNLNAELEKSLGSTMTPKMIEAIKFVLYRRQELALMPTITFRM